MPLVHYSKWKKGKKYGPNALILDPENYRLDKTTGVALSEAQIIEQLVLREGVKGLASEIVTKGYMPVEDVIIVEQNGRKLVVEGNRRLCAFKLLAKPKLAPTDSQKFFERLKQKAGDELPSQIYCVIAPNRAEANVFIFSKHADESFSKRWQSIRQAAFIANEIAAGKSIEEVTVETGLSRSKIIEGITGLDLYRLSGTMDLSNRASVLMTSPTTFPFTALVERIFGAEEIRKVLGVELTERGIIGTAGSRDGFLAVLKKIFEDLSEGTGDDAATRKYGTKEKAIKKISSFGYEAKGKGQWKAFRPEDVSFSSAKDNGTPPPDNFNKKKKFKKTKSRIEYLLPDDIEVEIGTPKLAMLIRESKTIDISLYCHSAAVFLRCIFELALNEAMDARKCKDAILAAHPKKVFKGEVNVATILEEIKPNKLLDLKLTQDELRGVGHLTKEGPLSFDLFHLFVHNKHWPATTESLIALRENILPILRKALLKPSTP